MQPKDIIYESVTQEYILSQGTVDLTLNIDDRTLKHNFFIVTQNIPLDTNGMLGKDFLEKYFCKIYYVTYTLIINTNEQKLIIPIESNILNKIIIPSRSEGIYCIQNKLT